MMTHKKNESQALTFGLIAVLCWSTVATAFKIALSHQTISSVVFCASLTSVILLGVVLAFQGKIRQAVSGLGNHWRRALLFGALNPLLYYHVLLWAYDLLPAQVAQPINYTWAIMLALLSVPFLGHALRQTDVLALIVCYSGVVIISLGASSGGVETKTLGVTLALISTIIWAGYWILNSRDQRDPITALFQNFLMVVPISAVLAWPMAFTWQGLTAGVYIGVFEMGLSFICWLYAMKLTQNASKISNLIFISPFISLILVHFVLGESIHNYTFIGLACIVTGLVIQNRSRPDKQNKTKA